MGFTHPWRRKRKYFHHHPTFHSTLQRYFIGWRRVITTSPLEYTYVTTVMCLYNNILLGVNFPFSFNTCKNDRSTYNVFVYAKLVIADCIEIQVNRIVIANKASFRIFLFSVLSSFSCILDKAVFVPHQLIGHTFLPLLLFMACVVFSLEDCQISLWNERSGPRINLAPSRSRFEKR